MFAKAGSCNELGQGEISVWCQVNSGISPSEWAGLCRKIAKLSPREFEVVAALVDTHSSIKNRVKRQVQGLLRLNQGQDVPLVCVGPDGIGGEYEQEWGL